MSRIINCAGSAALPNAAASRSSKKGAAGHIAVSALSSPPVPEPLIGAKAESGERRPRAGSKLALILDQLILADGATIAELELTTGWQPNTVRAAMTGLKQRGYEVVRDPRAAGAQYRVMASPAAAAHEELAS